MPPRVWVLSLLLLFAASPRSEAQSDAEVDAMIDARLAELPRWFFYYRDRSTQEELGSLDALPRSTLARGLERGLRRHDVFRRGLLVRWLTELEPPMAQSKLLGLLENSDRVAPHVVRALLKGGAEGTVVGLLEDERRYVRRAAVEGLTDRGEAVALLAVERGLDDEEPIVRVGSLYCLRDLDQLYSGTEWSAGILLSLGDMAGHDSYMACHRPARALLESKGRSLKRAGKVLWWVILGAYWRELGLLLLALLVWFGLSARFPRHRPRGRLALIGLILLVGVPPVITSVVAVEYVLSREWLEVFVPKSPILQVPVVIASALSVALLNFLATIGAVASKRAPREEAEADTDGLQATPATDAEALS